MGKQKINMRDEEELAREVRKYVCLYDKRLPSYKDKRVKANAWLEVERALGLKEGQHGNTSTRFEKLKRRYRIRKTAVRKAKSDSDGTGRTRALDKAEADLKQYTFLRWVDPFVSNITPHSFSKFEDTDDDEEPEINIHDYEVNYCVPAVSEVSDYGVAEVKKENYEESEKQTVEIPKVKLIRPIDRHLSKLPNGGIPSSFKKRKVPTTIDDVPLATNDQRLHPGLHQEQQTARNEKKPHQDDEFDAFGVVVANELRSLPKGKQLKLKHDINNAIYKYQCEVEAEDTSHPPLQPPVCFPIQNNPPQQTSPIYTAGRPAKSYRKLIDLLGQVTDSQPEVYIL